MFSITPQHFFKFDFIYFLLLLQRYNTFNKVTFSSKLGLKDANIKHLRIDVNQNQTKWHNKMGRNWFNNLDGLKATIYDSFCKKKIKTEF